METSPYAPPHSQFAEAPKLPPNGPPPISIKVFGILHLVIAGLGIVGGVGSALMTAFFGEFMGWLNGLAGRAGDDAMTRAQVAYFAEIGWHMWLSLAVSGVLIVMLLVAGVRLLKYRDSGREWSVRYAWTSVGTKVVFLVLTVIFILPAAQRLNEAAYGGAGEMAGMLKVTTAVSTLAGMLGTMIYPVLVLVFMNRASLRDYLAGR